MVASNLDYIATRNEIIEGAFRIVGALEVGQTLTANMLDQGIKALQLLIKSWSSKHLFLWTFNTYTFSILSGNAYDDQDDALIGLDKAWIVDATTSEDIALEVVSWSAYNDIQDKTTTGRPLLIAYKPTPEPRFYVWPTTDDDYDIKCLCIYPLQDFDSASGSADTIVRFQRALKYGLAEDLFDEYPGPMNERQYVQGKAAELFREAKNSDRPIETTNEVAGMFGRRY